MQWPVATENPGAYLLIADYFVMHTVSILINAALAEHLKPPGHDNLVACSTTTGTT